MESEHKHQMTNFTVNYAQPDDIDSIKKLADTNKQALGFLPRIKVLEAIGSKRVMVLWTPEELGGFVIYRHRKTDRQTTLSDICVAAKWRGRKGGKLLIDALYTECVNFERDFILLKCPQELPANHFYESIGFRRIRTEAGRARQLNVWQLDITDTEAS